EVLAVLIRRRRVLILNLGREDLRLEVGARGGLDQPVEVVVGTRVSVRRERVAVALLVAVEERGLMDRLQVARVLEQVRATLSVHQVRHHEAREDRDDRDDDEKLDQGEALALGWMT